MKREVYLVALVISIYLVSALEIPVDLVQGGKNLRVSGKDTINFRYSGFKHRFVVKDIQDDHVTLTLENLERTGPKKDISLVVNDIREVDVDNDNKPDLSVGLTGMDNRVGVFNINQLEKEPAVKAEKNGTGEKKDEHKLTEQEQGDIQNLMKTLGNPYIFQGISLINGKLTFFDLAKGIALSKAQESLSKSNPDAAILFGVYNLYNQYSGAITPARKERNKATGQAILDVTGNPILDQSFMLAAYDGKDIYLNFRIQSSKNLDLGFLFGNKGTFLGKNIDIYKDFSDLTIGLDPEYSSSVIINEDVFSNVEGKIELMKDQVKINRLDLVSLKDNNKLHINGDNPFYVTLNRSGRIIYDGKNLEISNGFLEFENKNHVVKLDKGIKADNVKVQVPSKIKVDSVKLGDYSFGATSTRRGETTLHVFGSKEFFVDNLRVKASNYDLMMSENVLFNKDNLKFISDKETSYERENKVAVKRLVSIPE